VGRILAVECRWIAESGDWSDPANWDTGTEPINNLVKINNGGVAKITQLNEWCGFLYLGSDSGTSGTIEMTDGSLTSLGVMIATLGTGTFNQSGGTHSISQRFEVHRQGTYNLIGPGQLQVTAAKEYILGTFNQTAGTHTSSDISINGIYNLSGTGQLSAHYQYVLSTFSQSGGSDTAKELHIGSNIGSGVYRLSGNGQLIADSVFVGENANYGSFVQTGGTSTINNKMSIRGASSTMPSVYTLSGNGTLNIGAGGELFVDSNGRFEWFTNGLTTPKLTVAPFSSTTIAMGFDFNFNSLVDGSLFGGSSAVSWPSWMTLEITNNATVTQDALVKIPLFINMVIGTSQGSGSFILKDTGSLDFASVTIGGPSGIGTFQQEGGANKCGITLGEKNGTGTYILSGNGTLSGSQRIGMYGTGTFKQIGGTNSGTLYVGRESGSNGTYELSGPGTLSSNEYVGYSGTGYFTQSAGVNTCYSMYLGYNSGAVGTYDLSDAGTITSSSATTHYIGYSGNGVFNQSGGTYQVGTLNLANQTGSKGTFNLTGGTLSVSTIAKGSGTAAFNFGGGTLDIKSDFTSGVPITLTGIGGNSNFRTNSQVAISLVLSGQGGLNKLGSGTLTLSGANAFTGETTVAEGVLTLGNAAALQKSTLDYNAYGGTLSFGTLTSATLGGLIGGQALQLNNANSTGVALQVGNNNLSQTYSGNLSGNGSLTKIGSGKLTLSGTNTYLGATTVNAGSLQAVTPNALSNYGGAGKVIIGQSGRLAINAGGNGEWTPDNIQSLLSGVSVTSGGMLAIDTTNADGGCFTYDRPIAGKIGLVKNGPNRLNLTGSNTYSGTTKVDAGILSVNNSTGYGAYRVTVNSGGTLSGAGSIGGTLTVNDGGILAPGNSPGILTVQNAVTLKTGASLNMEIDGLTPGTNYDQLKTAGTVSLEGTLSLAFGAFSPAGNDILFLIDNTGTNTTTGRFQYADDEIIGHFNGYDWFITYDANNAGLPSLNGGNDVAVYSVVPEPAQLLLLALAAGCGAFLKKRRSN
jgi:autotransporter-associated beta strand protein